jgi:hypothetical protein
MADYPISNVPRRVQYVNSGVGPYAFTFAVLVQTDIAVYRGNTLLTLTTDYSVAINSNGTGSITLVTAGTGNITIVGARAIQRSSDYTTGGDLFASTLNVDLDSQTIFSQQLAESINRTVAAPVTDASTLDMQLPTSATRANKLFGFNSVGAPIVSTNTVSAVDAAVSTINSIAGAPAGSSAGISHIAAGAGAVSTTVQAKLRQTVSPQDFGAVGDGIADDGPALQLAIDAVGLAGGGVINGNGLTYLNQTTNLAVNYDDVWIENANFVRTSNTSGFLLNFATTADTSGGGVQNCTFTGIPTNTSGNAAVRFGTKNSAGVGFKANKWTLNNVNCTSWTQFGVAIEAGDDWVVSNVKVFEHGLTSGTISSCIGFYVFPKFASQGGQINNVYSQISDACVANASANTAAIKLQTHQRLLASNITAIYGSESSFVIDSVQGTINNVYVRQQLSDAGLVVGNYNPNHSFSGQKFTLDGFIVEGSGSAANNEFLIGGGAVGQYKLTGCVIRNGRAGGAGYLNLSNTNSCLFENLSFGDMRFSSAIRGFTINALPSTNNIYRNITVDSSAGGGTIAIETSNSLLANCGGVAQDGDLVGSFVIYGDSNQITNPFVVNGSTNALTIRGDSNEIFNLEVTNITGRTLFFPSGSDNNTVYGSSNLATAGTGIINSGTNNVIYGFSPTVVADVGNANGIPSWISGQRTFVWNTALTANRSVTLNTAGVPNGARYRIVRTANSTGAFNLNVGSGPLKALATGQWCDVEYDGNAWSLTAFGSL